jgi:hypothetical protein
MEKQKPDAPHSLEYRRAATEGARMQRGPLPRLVVAIACGSIGIGAGVIHITFFQGRSRQPILFALELLGGFFAVVFLMYASRRWQYTQTETVLIFLILGLAILSFYFFQLLYLR